MIKIIGCENPVFKLNRLTSNFNTRGQHCNYIKGFHSSVWSHIPSGIDSLKTHLKHLLTIF